jgi:hypothetical protein
MDMTFPFDQQSPQASFAAAFFARLPGGRGKKLVKGSETHGEVAGFAEFTLRVVDFRLGMRSGIKADTTGSPKGANGQCLAHSSDLDLGAKRQQSDGLADRYNPFVWSYHAAPLSSQKGRNSDVVFTCDDWHQRRRKSQGIL